MSRALRITFLGAVGCLLMAALSVTAEVDWVNIGTQIRSGLEETGMVPDNWDVDSAPCICNASTCTSQWEGIECPQDPNYEGVYGLSLQNLPAGGLPETWPDAMPLLRSLDLRNSKCTGSLPDSWSDFQSLTFLDLSQNALDGSLPASWSTMSSLITLNVASNSLQGSLQESWSAIQNLASLNLENNHLTGTIPTAWSQLSKLSSLMLSNNPGVCGDQPAWIKDGSFNTSATNIGQTCWQQVLIGIRDKYWLGNADNFETWDLSTSPCDASQPWEGVSCDVNGLISILEVSIDNAKVVPDELSVLTSLTVLSMNTNVIQGTLPKAYSTLTKLVSLSFNENQLKGTLPAEWSTLTALSFLDVSANNLTGTIPASWTTLQQLETLTMFGNGFSGSLPPVLSSTLTDFSVRNNRFSGSLPSSWSSLTQLTSLELHINSLTGPLPPSWSTLQALYSLYLGNNALSGTVPPGWTAMTSLRTLRLINNPRLCGDLPNSSKWIVVPMGEAPSANFKSTEVNIDGSRLDDVCALPAPGRAELGGGAIAGVVIGVLVVLAVIGWAAWVLYIRHRPNVPPLQRKFSEMEPYRDLSQHFPPDSDAGRGVGHGLTIINRAGPAKNGPTHGYATDMELHNF